MVLKRLFRGGELPDPFEQDERVRELKRIAGGMAGPLEEVFQSASNPSYCTVVSLVVAKYLRDRGFDAELVPAIYTKRHPRIAEEEGFLSSWGSSINAKAFGRLPLYERNPKSFVQRGFKDDPMEGAAYARLYRAEDTFVRVRVTGGLGAGYYMIHPTYRQFIPEGKREKCPAVVFDKIDAKKLRSKYHLALLSPETATKLRYLDRFVFDDKISPEASEELTAFREVVRGLYADFKKKME